MEHDPRFLHESGRDVLGIDALILKGALESFGGVHLITGCTDPSAGSTDPVAPVFARAEAVSDRLGEYGCTAGPAHDPAAALARAAAVGSVGGRALVVLGVDSLSRAAVTLAEITASPLAENAGLVVVCLDTPDRVSGDPRLIAAHAGAPWLEAADCQQVKDHIPAAFELSVECGAPILVYIAPHLARAFAGVRLRANHATTVNPRQRATLHEQRELRAMATRFAEDASPIASRLPAALADARRRQINRLDYRAQRGERVGLGFVVTGSLDDVFAEAMESLDLQLRFPTLTLGLTHPPDDTLIGELVTQCERVIVVEAGDPLLERRVASVANAALARDEPAAEVFGRQFPFDHSGLPSSTAIDPATLIDRIGRLLRARPSLTGGLKPIEREAIDRALPSDDDTGVGPRLPRRTTTWAPGSTMRDLAALISVLRRDLLDTNYMHPRRRGAATALMVYADEDCGRRLGEPPHRDLLHELAPIGTAGAASASAESLTTNRRVVLMSGRGLEGGGLDDIRAAVDSERAAVFIVVAVDRYAHRGDGLPNDPGADAASGARIERLVRSLYGRKAKRNANVVRLDPREWEPMRNAIEEAVFDPGVTVVIADPLVESGLRRDEKVRLEQAAIHGFAPQATFDHIAGQVCENCLVCTQRVGCPSLRSIPTERGPKVRIDRSVSVNDGAASRVDVCPAFEKVTVLRNRPPRRHSPRVRRIRLPDLPRPRHATHAVWRCCVSGIDGSGIKTVAPLLAEAGRRMGYHVRGMARQRADGYGGSVVDYVAFTRDADRPGTALIGVGRADLLIAGDSREAARAIETPMGPIVALGRSRLVIDDDPNPTLAQLAGQEARRDSVSSARLERLVSKPDRFAFPIGRACEALLGDRSLQPLALLGAAFQRGELPLTLEAIEAAITASSPPGRAGEPREAFDLGRRIVAEPKRMQRLFDRPPESPERAMRYRAHILRVWRRRRGYARRYVQLVAPVIEAMAERGVDDSIRRDVVTYAYDAVVWAGKLTVARKYCRRVLETMKKDTAARRWAATRAVVVNLARVVLIKDEPYVAAMLTSPEKLRRDRREFGVFPGRGDRIVYRRDHKPEPVLLGRGFRFHWRSRAWHLRLLARCRWLRWMLPGWSRPQRQFRDWYKKLVDRSSWDREGSGADYDRWVTLLRLPESCTGFREVLYPKLQRAMDEADALLEELESAGAETTVGVPERSTNREQEPVGKRRG